MNEELDLDELQRLADAATEGPWLVDAHHWGAGIMDDDGDQLFVESHGLTYSVNPDDAEFIAAARDAVPALLDRVRKLEAADDIGSETIVRVAMERDAARSTIAKVEAVHVEVSTPPNGGYCTTCTGQSDFEVTWPCPTIRALGSVPSTGEGNE